MTVAVLANQIASGWDEVFVVVNAVLAGGAFGFNLAAALDARRRSFRGRAIHSAVAALALAHAVAYMALVATDVSVVEWSSVMRGVSIAAWLIAWIRHHRRRRSEEDHEQCTSNLSLLAAEVRRLGGNPALIVVERRRTHRAARPPQERP